MDALDSRQKSLTEAVAVLRSLDAALANAYSALRNNDLRMLENCVAEQEELSARLASLPGDLQKSLGSDAAARQLCGTISDTTRQFSALLRKSARTVNLLASLHRCYASAKPKTNLSCEA